MSEIKILSQNLINLIAAGEVVERPASALKELLENSIDAGATYISVNIEDYGNKQIQVKDNGKGMDKNDALLSIKQHATSKIRSEEDLNTLSSMGFRGEALASITAIAESLIIETKTKDSSAIKLKIAQDNIEELISTQTNNGTTISINNIFNKIPARKKFLKSPSTELKYLFNTFIETSLNFINIHFDIYHNKKLIHKLTKTDNLKDRIFQIWGSQIAQGLYKENNITTSSYNIKILLGKPEISTKTVKHNFIYVNNRYVINKVITAAVQEAFKGFIHRDLRPIFYIVIHIDPSKIDVNVHPRKLEVKFEDSSQIFKIVYSSIRKILENETKQLVINSTINEDNNTHNNYLIKDKSIINNFSTNYPSNDTIGNKDFAIKNSSQTSQYNDNISNKFISKNKFSSKNSKINEALSFTEALLQDSFRKDVNAHSTFNENIKQINNLSDKLQIDNKTSLLQIFKTYILFEKDDNLIMLDQHASAEKILFESLMKQVGVVKTKPLLIPEIIELTHIDKELVISKLKDLAQIGIIIEDFGNNTLKLTEIPEQINSLDIEDYINEIIKPDENIINSFKQSYNLNSLIVNKEIYIMIATMACHGSIRAGQTLNFSEMSNIVKQLSTCDNPYNCPHGRPTIWHLSKNEIDKKFQRDL